jgi:serine/threonine protein kinase
VFEIRELRKVEMSIRVERLRIGPYQLVRQLEAGRLAERWLAFNEAEQTPHVAYRFKMGHDKAEHRRFMAALEALSPLSHPHLLPVEQFAFGIGGGAWVVSPYTGNHDGLVTLSSLVRDKGGMLIPGETERALTQILGAAEYAHSAGHQHGGLSPAEILVDRRGSLMIELYGLGRKLQTKAARPATEVIRDEVRAIVEIGYWLLTGLSAEEPRIQAGRLIPKLDRRWDEWFETGLDPLAGFLSAEEALGSMPGTRREIEVREKSGPVKTVIGRFARALRSS